MTIANRIAGMMFIDRRQSPDGRIGTGAEESGMSEAEIAGQAEQDVEPVAKSNRKRLKELRISGANRGEPERQENTATKMRKVLISF